MSKELPYFKFFPNEWITGDITLKSMELQGIFINVCSMYWSKGCRIAIAGLSQRYGMAIAELLESGLIKEKEGFAVINFLDEQWREFDHTHQKYSKNGILGNEIRWKKSHGNRTPVALRGEERRGEKKFIPPSVDDVVKYFKENGYTEISAIKAFNYYSVAEWKDSKGKKVKNWKQKMQGVWFKDENKIITNKDRAGIIFEKGERDRLFTQ